MQESFSIERFHYDSPREDTSSSSTQNSLLYAAQDFDSMGNADYLDLTPHLALPQNKAAHALSLHPSTLSKLWKKATNNQKWPYRTLKGLDKQINTLLRNLEINPQSQDVLRELNALLDERKRVLKPVVLSVAKDSSSRPL